MSKSIKISPQHGLNPSMILCPYCRQPKGIALMGRLPQDREAPREVVCDYEPCEDCRKLFEGNVLCLDVVETPTFEGQEAVFQDEKVRLYQTFRFMVLNKEWAHKTFNMAEKDTTLLLAHTAFDSLYDEFQQFLEQPEES